MILNEVQTLIILVGIGTYLIRLVFLLKDFEVLKTKVVAAGLNSVPVTMLVALVIPYTFFVGNQLVISRPEVWAIIFTIPIVYYTKKAGLGIIIAFTLYFLISWLFF